MVHPPLAPPIEGGKLCIDTVNALHNIISCLTCLGIILNCLVERGGGLYEKVKYNLVGGNYFFVFPVPFGLLL